MERTTIKQAKEIFGNNFIGPEQLNFLFKRMNIEYDLNEVEIPEINYSYHELLDKGEEYILILGLPLLRETILSIEKFREVFGVEPAITEPCFYNQDWYLNEDFIKIPLECNWYLLKKTGIEESRSIQPENLINLDYHFPSAILCTYTFFAYYFVNNEILWHHDFIWCSDKDHNGDRIYVGKYNDIDGVNKNGFSIHRYLSLRKCYASINVL